MLEKITLCHTSPGMTLGPALLQPFQTVELVLEVVRQRQDACGNQTIDQIRGDVHQSPQRRRQQAQEAAGIFRGDGAQEPRGTDLTGEQAEYLAEGKVGIAQAGIGVAIAEGDHQVGYFRLGTAGELLDESGLAAARLAGNEGDTALSCQRCPQMAPQSNHLRLAADEGVAGG